MAASRNNNPRQNPCARLVEQAAILLREQLPQDATLWVGLSGGRDSVVLLHLCKTLLPPGKLRAVHVHHGLSPHADEWAAFCATLCRDWKIPLEIMRVHVPKTGAEGLEAAARDARYGAYRKCAREHGARYLALAHHRRDQAETLLFNLCRGAGVAGAAAMPMAREEQGGLAILTFLRPLLESSAKAVGDYAAHYAMLQQLQWVEDESNQDERYSRNFLRHQILPQLEARFPAAETTLARAAHHFSEAQTLLVELAAEDDERIQDQRATLLTFSFARQANWLRYWLTRKGWRAPGAAALTEALRQIAHVTDDNHLDIKLREGSLRLWRGRLYGVACLPTDSSRSSSEARAWDGKTPCAWAGGLLRLEATTGQGLNAALLAGRRLELRSRQGGESICPAPNRPRRPLKKLLQESRIPPWERERLPLIYLENELIAVPDVAIAAQWQCPADQPGLRVVWIGVQ
jgi:tRNA(Ile)-lysidine synthase